MWQPASLFKCFQKFWWNSKDQLYLALFPCVPAVHRSGHEWKHHQMETLTFRWHDHRPIINGILPRFRTSETRFFTVPSATKEGCLSEFSTVPFRLEKRVFVPLPENIKNLTEYWGIFRSIVCELIRSFAGIGMLFYGVIDLLLIKQIRPINPFLVDRNHAGLDAYDRWVPFALFKCLALHGLLQAFLPINCTQETNTVST